MNARKLEAGNLAGLEACPRVPTSLDECPRTRGWKFSRARGLPTDPGQSRTLGWAERGNLAGLDDGLLVWRVHAPGGLWGQDRLLQVRRRRWCHHPVPHGLEQIQLRV